MQHPALHPQTTNRVQFVLFGVWNRACGPCLAAMHGILIPVNPGMFGAAARRAPFQGFVSNKDTDVSGDKADPIEGLLYSVFVASNERAGVSELAEVLSVDEGKLREAISIACRLGFGSRLSTAGAGEGERAPFYGSLRVPICAMTRRAAYRASGARECRAAAHCAWTAGGGRDCMP
jgi:FAM91 N-terminus